jgi:hypothetical protein
LAKGWQLPREDDRLFHLFDAVEEEIERLYFPISGVASLQHISKTGRPVDTAFSPPQRIVGIKVLLCPLADSWKISQRTLGGRNIAARADRVGRRQRFAFRLGSWGRFRRVLIRHRTVHRWRLFYILLQRRALRLRILRGVAGRQEQRFNRYLPRHGLVL